MKVQFLSLSILTAVALSGCGGGGSTQQAASTGGSEKSGQESPATTPAGGANISGSVKFSGTAPKKKKINMGADAFCKTAHTGAVAAEDIVVNPGGTLKNVYVYVKKGLGDTKFPVPSEPVVLDQVGCVYTPHVVAAQVGQEVIIKNSDGVLHNVNARPTKNKPFNIGQPVKGMSNKKVFTAAEVAIPIKCDVHPWMGGYIAIQNHSFHGVTGEDGNFSIKGLPAGTYEIEAWHEKLGTSVQTVTVGATDSKEISFSFAGKS